MIDTDVWQPTAGPASCRSEASASPSPPPSSPSDDGFDLDTAAPYYGKLAAWQRDVALLPNELPTIDAAAITHDVSGARLSTNAQGQAVLLMANPAGVHSQIGIKDLLLHGLTRHATRLTFDKTKQKLVRTRMGGKKVSVRSGTYAFVIDQDGDLLLSLTSSAKEDAAAGAHLSLTAGLPVLFAGELTIKDGAIIGYTANSGSYRTPYAVCRVAQEHPLLQDVVLHALEHWAL